MLKYFIVTICFCSCYPKEVNIIYTNQYITLTSGEPIQSVYFLDKDENHIGTIIRVAASEGNDTIFFNKQNVGYSNRGNTELTNPILIKIGVHTTHVIRYHQITPASHHP